MASQEQPTVEIVVGSEDQAWELFAAAHDGDLPAFFTLRFDGWPLYSFTVRGRDWHGTVPTRIMGPLLEVQKDLRRAYADVARGSRSAVRLTDDERDDLELIVKVDEGSSAFITPLDHALTKIAEEAAKHMSGPEFVIAIVGLALVWGTKEVTQSWIRAREQIKRGETQVALSQQETRRLEIFADAVSKSQPLAAAATDAEQSESRILKSLKPDDRIAIKGVTLEGAVAKEVAKPERESSRAESVTGVFRIVGNRTDVTDGFRITVQRDDGLSFSANVPMELSGYQRAILRDAEWSKEQIELAVEASTLRGNITAATVVSVRAVSKSTPPGS